MNIYLYYFIKKSKKPESILQFVFQRPEVYLIIFLNEYYAIIYFIQICNALLGALCFPCYRIFIYQLYNFISHKYHKFDFFIFSMPKSLHSLHRHHQYIAKNIFIHLSLKNKKIEKSTRQPSVHIVQKCVNVVQKCVNIGKKSVNSGNVKIHIFSYRKIV